MKITYLYNSGFYILQKNLLFIFDYIPEGGAKIDKGLMLQAEHVYVFVSHHHGDHFSRKIWDWQKEREDITYLLSADVPGEGIHLTKGDEWRDDKIYVRAHGSTDEGVSFEIRVSGKVLFHAGDLNCWHWEGENSAEEEKRAREWFKRELGEIQKEAAQIDVALFPVDSRMQGNYDDGAAAFILQLHPKWLIPMHFRQDINAPKEFAKKKFPGTHIVAMTNPMEEIEY